MRSRSALNIDVRPRRPLGPATALRRSGQLYVAAMEQHGQQQALIGVASVQLRAHTDSLTCVAA
ncbi:hypothetical protein [Bradyrhizobium sp. USDA 4506]